MKDIIRGEIIIEIINLSLEYDADPHMVDINGKTSIMWCAYADKLENLELMISLKVDINALDFEGMTALATWSERNNIKIVQMLLVNGAY